ncbi:MAG: site-specific integrase [Bacteroidetes bacterium]|nr:site-specific integrase [Bacteroidota bacterium]
MAKFNFNLREPESEGETAVHLVVRWNNNRLVFPTKERINPKFWETDKEKRNFQRATETKQFPTYPEFNAKLDKIKGDAKDIFRRFENDNEHRQPTVEELRELLYNKFNPSSNIKKKDLFSFIEKFIEESKSRINDKTGRMYSAGIIHAYKNTLRLLHDFKKKKGKRIDFNTIDLDFYHDFSEYLTKEIGFANNTIGGHIKRIKTFLNEATERGINTNLAYKSKRFKVITEETDSIYLNEKELEAIYKLDLSNNSRLDRVRDLFLVGCWTGLRFSDFSNIKPENIKGDFIEIETKKTAEPVSIPIHWTVKQTMKKYKGKYPNSLPPAISNVKMNEYIKELGEIKELEKTTKSLHAQTPTSITKGGVNITTNNKKFELITMHTARRSFASNLYLDGVPPITIMKITGHKTEKAFMRYIKITPNESAKILQLHWQKKHKLQAV